MNIDQLAQAIVDVCAHTEVMTSDQLAALLEVIEQIAGGDAVLAAIAFVDHQRRLAEEAGE